MWNTVVAHLARVTIAPITSTIRGVCSEVVLGAEDGMRTPCAVNLFNLTTVPRRVLGRRVTTRSPDRMGEVCAAIAFALACGE